MSERAPDYVNMRLSLFVDRKRMMASFIADSNVVNSRNVAECTPTVEYKDIKVGRTLGSGGFSHVKSIRQLPSFASTSERSMNSNVSSSSNPSNYALKTLRQDLSASTKKLGEIDFQKEAAILSSLRHRNIVSIHSASSFEEDYFLVIEKLETCLDKKILEWSFEKKRIQFSKQQKSLKTNQLTDFLHMRLRFCYQISSGFSYLHDMNILYRDLKPENVGVDSQGVVKIFDFGLAKELKAKYKVGDDEYKLSVAGTRRYMAPEVFLKKAYGKPADVYSFALTMWEILALEKPYLKLSVVDMTQKVCHKGKRPSSIKDVDKDINEMMSSSWSQDPKVRLTMNDVHEKLGAFLSDKGAFLTQE